MGAGISGVMPAKAGIQALLLDSRQERAGMTISDFPQRPGVSRH